MKYSLALFLLFIGLSSALAQAKPKPRKKLTITEWIHAMRDCRDSVYLLRNADIVPDGNAARYVAVVEGIVGWFLFSIFGASLIGQILQ
jgi:hypothetical protein